MTDEIEEDIGFAAMDPWTKSARQMLGLLDTPAYLRRALKVQDAINALQRRCEKQRKEWLQGVHLRLKAWRLVSAKDLATLGELTQRQREALTCLMQMLGVEPGATHWNLNPGRPGRVLSDLIDSTKRFNQRWERFVQSVDCSRANELIDGYNRYYLFEKECAFRSPRLASVGYKPLELLTPAHLFEMFPLLPDLEAD